MEKVQPIMDDMSIFLVGLKDSVDFSFLNNEVVIEGKNTTIYSAFSQEERIKDSLIKMLICNSILMFSCFLFSPSPFMNVIFPIFLNTKPIKFYEIQFLWVVGYFFNFYINGTKLELISYNSWKTYASVTNQQVRKVLQ